MPRDGEAPILSSFLARRLEVLSDIMFGVAMTVPVYSLPLPRAGVPLGPWYPVLRPMLGPLADARITRQLT